MRPRREVDETVATSRPKRVPVSQSRDVLSVKNLPEDMVGRWVNDVSDRVLKFLEGSWEFVTDKGICVGERTVEASRDCGQTIRRLVGTGPHNEPVYAYLMAITKDLYNEDQARKQDEVDSVEEQIYEQAESMRKEAKQHGGTYGKFKIEQGE